MDKNKTQRLREEMRAAVKQFKFTSGNNNKDGKVEYPTFLVPAEKLEP